MKKIITYVYLDQKGGLKLRKSAYRLDEGEIRVKLTIKVPDSFYKKRTAELEADVKVTEEKIGEPEVLSTTN